LLVPGSLQIEAARTARTGESRTAWLSIVSFLDSGSNGGERDGFEQTSYHLHVRRDGEPAQWLLGVSLGSLAAVAARNYWGMPWHLSAMEFQTSYDSAADRYGEFSLHTQSQWASASWEISDTGDLISNDEFDCDFIPGSLFSSDSCHYFERRDGSPGYYRTRFSDLRLKRGIVTNAECDLLEELGLLTSDEIRRPAFAATQRSMACQMFSPGMIDGSRSPAYNYEIGAALPAFAS
jgi:hypothetical protein